MARWILAINHIFSQANYEEQKGMSKKKKLKTALREAIERSIANMDTVKQNPVNDRKERKGQ